MQKYEDNTIHFPNSIQDDLDIKIKSKLESEISPIQRISIGDVLFTDSFSMPAELAINETN